MDDNERDIDLLLSFAERKRSLVSRKVEQFFKEQKLRVIKYGNASFAEVTTWAIFLRDRLVLAFTFFLFTVFSLSCFFYCEGVLKHYRWWWWLVYWVWFSWDMDILTEALKIQTCPQSQDSMGGHGHVNLIKTNLTKGVSWLGEISFLALKDIR